MNGALKKKICFDFWQYQWQHLPYVIVEVALVIGIGDNLWKAWAKFWKLSRSPLTIGIKTLLEFSDMNTGISAMEENIIYCYTCFTFQQCQDVAFLPMHGLFLGSISVILEIEKLSSKILDAW